MNIVFIGDSLTEGVPGVSYFKIMEKKFPVDSLYNFGKGGDTVKSIYDRLKKTRLPDVIDIAFLWVGINDIFAKLSVPNVISHTISNQFPSMSFFEFKKNFRKVLKLVYSQSKKVFVISPLFIGEDYKNEWNIEVSHYNDIIIDAANEYSNTEYLNLREIFLSKLSGKKLSKYMPERGFDMMADALTFNPEELDERSRERGLYYTIDGVHLNNTGANITADFLEYAIKYAFN